MCNLILNGTGIFHKNTKKEILIRDILSSSFPKLFQLSDQFQSLFFMCVNQVAFQYYPYLMQIRMLPCNTFLKRLNTSCICWPSFTRKTKSSQFMGGKMLPLLLMLNSYLIQWSATHGLWAASGLRSWSALTVPISMTRTGPDSFQLCPHHFNPALVQCGLGGFSNISVAEGFTYACTRARHLGAMPTLPPVLPVPRFPAAAWMQLPASREQCQSWAASCCACITARWRGERSSSSFQWDGSSACTITGEQEAWGSSGGLGAASSCLALA